jgi:DNA-binding MarR family transcriptional regulator
MAKEKAPPPVSRRVSLGHLLKTIAREARLDPQSFKREGRTARMVEARDRFICQAVWEEGYLAAELARFLGCHPSNVSRALQKGLTS